jgi:hypothetical protein
VSSRAVTALAWQVALNAAAAKGATAAVKAIGSMDDALLKFILAGPAAEVLYAAGATSDTLGKQASKLSRAAAALVTRLAGELALIETQARAACIIAPGALCLLPPRGEPPFVAAHRRHWWRRRQGAWASSRVWRRRPQSGATRCSSGLKSSRL